MAINIQFIGAAGEVTGSCHLVTVGKQRILLDCGLIQGGHEDEARNREPFPFDPKNIDAVVLSHAHIDHSGRLPMLVKAGFRGVIYTHRACRDLCRIMLKDSGFLSEKDAVWENRKRARKGLEPVEPLFTVEDAKFALQQFKGLVYAKKQRILPGVHLRLSDAGHILGSSIVELWLKENGETRKLVFSGDLGRSGMPVLQDPASIQQADLVIMESTYGDRLHRSWENTHREIHEVLSQATAGKGNILMPSFAVGRTQEILYLFAKYYKEWELNRWQIFLDSPLAIEATRVFTQHSDLFDADTAALWRQHNTTDLLPNLHISRTTNQSMAINRIRSGAIIIAGSGMCTGGRIKQHLKHNIWRKECQLVITGFQARGTLGRALVDGAKHIRLWGETIRVAATVHTIGGLSAHADQASLKNWYANFEGRPPVILVHGEEKAIAGLSDCLHQQLSAPVHAAHKGEIVDLAAAGKVLIGGKVIK
jgi:metallo-beta-lactamase family protein